MSLPMRITFENQDYTYSVLTKVLNKDTKEIKIILAGEELTLARNEKREWDALKRTIGDNEGLIKAIVQNVVLRYRL